MPSAAELERLFRLVIDPLCIAGFDGYFKQINPALARTLGYTETELLAKPYLDFIHPDDVEPTIGAAAKVSNGMTVLEFRKSKSSRDSVPTAPSKPTCGSLLRPIGISRKWSPIVSFEATSITG